MSRVERWAQSVVEHDAALQAAGNPTRAIVLPCAFPDAADALTPAIEQFVDAHYAGGTLLVKTSTPGDRPTDHEVSPELVRIVLEAVCRRVPPRHVRLADGPAYPIDYVAECRRIGWADIAEGLGVEMTDLNATDAEERVPGWPLSQTFLRADAVINLTKAKTHRRFGVSLAEKSLLGVVVGARTGYPKLLGRHDHVPWLITHIVADGPPLFSVVDGDRGIQGEGPLDGVPTDSAFLVYGTDCLAVDLRAIVEMGFDPALVPLLCRPLPPADGRPPLEWSSLRQTGTDFEPSLSCAWLHHSLRRRARRSSRHKRLMKGAVACWPIAIGR